MTKTVTLEITKFKNKEDKNLFEWTKTFEIDYGSLDQNILSNEEKKIIQKEIEFKNSIEYRNKDKEDNSLLNTHILKMEGNPFYQPSMNTFEFDINDELHVNISSNIEPVDLEIKLASLKKLLDEKIITQNDYELQKKELFENVKK